MQNVLSRLWLWFWYLLPSNPILIRVVFGSSRRTRHLWLRFGYLAALTGVVLIGLISSMSGQNPSLTELAKSASRIFAYASMTQLALMCFLAPMFTATAITQERDAQTFNILLSTPLSNGQIVFGSLISRLYFVIMLLIAGLPIFLMTMVYGGVVASQVFESFALSGATAVLTGALAIFIAMIGVGTRRTIFSFYLMIALYLMTVYLVGQWDRTWIDTSPINVNGRRMSWLAAFHPFLALEVALNSVHAPPVGRLGDHSSIARFALAFPSAAYVIWTTMLALLLTISSIFFVRRGEKTGEHTFFSGLMARLRRGDPDALTRKPRSVWKNPVAWREAKTRVSDGGLLRLAIVAGGFAGPLIVFIYYWNGSLVATSASRWLSGMLIVQLALALIIATNTAATSIAREKESNTMDMLLITPLTSRYILWGKLRGLVSFVFPLLAGPVSVLMLFGIVGLIRGDAPPAVWIETGVEVAALLVVYTAIACVVGLWRSLHSRSNMSAVMYSLAFMILLCGVTSLIGLKLVQASGSGEAGAFLAAFTPFTAMRFLVDPAALFDSNKSFVAGAGAARVAALIGSVTATTLYAFIVWRTYTGLVRNFDMTLRKQSGA